MSANNKTSTERFMCEQDGCGKDYASKSGMKEHMKKIHQNIVLSLVQDVVNFLSPQPNKNAEPITLPKSPKELFTTNESEEDEDTDEEDLIIAGERHDLMEALKLPIVPGGDWLRKTLPSGSLDEMLKHVHSHKKVQEAPPKPTPKILTCAQCMLGKEENRKQALLHKADKMAKKNTTKRLQ